jgi:hypothetical protein
LRVLPRGKNLTIGAYCAHVFGCGMIDHAFEGNDSSYAFAEAPLWF